MASSAKTIPKGGYNFIGTNYLTVKDDTTDGKLYLVDTDESNTLVTFDTTELTVGIGADSTGAKLSVHNPAANNTPSVANAALYLKAANVSYGCIFGSRSSSSGFWIQGTTAEAATGNLSLQPAGGSLGIGTSSLDADAILTISGGTRFGSMSVPTADSNFRAYLNSAVARFDGPGFQFDLCGGSVRAAALVVTGDAVRGGVDGVYDSGSAAVEWDGVYCAGLIESSDERTKEEIKPSPLGINFIRKLKPYTYKRKAGRRTIGEDGEVVVRKGERNHYGFLAQDVIQAAIECGEPDFAGWILADKNDPTSKQSLRPTQLLPAYASAIQYLDSELQSLKAQIAELESKRVR